MKKKILFAILISVLSIISFVMINPVQAVVVTEAQNTTVEALTKGDGEVTPEVDGSTVTMTFDSSVLEGLVWADKDAEIERPSGGWYIGFKVVLPEGVDKEKVTNQYIDYLGVINNPNKITIDKGTDRDYSVWVLIDNEKLENVKNKKLIQSDGSFRFATFKLSYQGNDTKDLTIILKVKPDNYKFETPENVITVRIEDEKDPADFIQFTMPKGKNLTADETDGGLGQQDYKRLQEFITPADGYKFLYLYDASLDEEKEFDLTKPITTDLTLKAKFEKLPIEEQKPTPEVQQPQQEAPKPETPKVETKVKDTTPKTGSENIELIVLAISVVSLIGIIITKKYSK